MQKNVIITGANSGIGKAATIKFAKNGYNVIMACRDLVDGKKVQDEINMYLENKSIDLIEVDMASFQSIHRFCKTFRSKYEKLDILIHNAGCLNHGAKMYQKSEDNLELTFAVNVFGPFLMTMLLKDLLIKSDDPRILGASSTNILHFFDEKRRIDFEDLFGKQISNTPYNSYKMYGDSKMAFGIINQRISEEFKEDGIKVNSLMISGAKVSKRNLKKVSPFFRVLATIQNLYLKPTSYIADNYFKICTSKEFKDITGELISDKGIILESAPKDMSFSKIMKELSGKSTCYPRYADDKEVQNKLWELCEEVCLKSC